MNHPTVSVVIATRNRPEMLRSAIEAVMEQSYPGPIECVVVFDRTEPDLSLSRDDESRQVVVVENSRVGGLAGARNAGILASTGELVAFCDDDDVWFRDKLEKQVERLGSADTSVTGIVIDYGGREVARVPKQETFTLKNLVETRLMEAHPSTVLVRRTALLDTIGLVDEDLPGSYGEDFDFILRAMQAGEVSVVEEALVTVRWGQSMFSRDWATIVAAIDYMIAKHSVLRASRKGMARLLGRRAFAVAALGRRGEALRDCGRVLRRRPTERRVYVTVPVALGLVSAERLLDLAHRRGHGI
ncbi:glycosyltransferase family 2 protein [uncultured Serinicoccus sp.]|uniref:glycosyltransferase family 2 protein n=1 Tax=uncultured Serinicoccus sp. TaxID=735514 RepID=UPI0026231EBF|nr:glycosyltransferase family 2 protein [uncultured Serinicoccus sp.]